MNTLYRSLGISKQAFHQKMHRHNHHQEESLQLLLIIYQLREDHPTMGCRDMYYKLQPRQMGRDAFEQFCKEEQLGIERKKNYRRTTDSTGVIRFDNLIKNLVLHTINQVWQSDITYYELNNRFYYLTFILDAYSRRIVGHATSQRLTTECTTLPALQQAIHTRKNMDLSGLIFHSDGGGQYYDQEFLHLTVRHNILNSMCQYPWENGKAERVNGIIKSNYLQHRKIHTLEQLQKEVDRSVQLYNEDKPHIALQRKTPVKFETDYICNRQKADGEKSATEYKLHPKGNNSPSGCRQKASGLNIAQEYKNPMSEQ